jgi:hypothetical protein
VLVEFLGKSSAFVVEFERSAQAGELGSHGEADCQMLVCMLKSCGAAVCSLVSTCSAMESRLALSGSVSPGAVHCKSAANTEEKVPGVLQMVLIT